MSECDHSKFSISYGMCNDPNHPEDCVSSKCDNCNNELGHDYGIYDNIMPNDNVGQQFRDIIFHGGAKEVFKDIPENCRSCGVEIPNDLPEDHLGMCKDCAEDFYENMGKFPEQDEDEVGGYNCRVCGRWSATLDENMNHRCFEE